MIFVVSDIKCGGTIKGTSGYISSPGYPKLFSHDQLCIWTIEVEKGKRIKLILDDMRLGEDCQNSYVMVRDGMTSEASQLGKFCPNQNNVVITSSGNSMWVELKAVYSNPKAFRAYWAVLGETGE